MLLLKLHNIVAALLILTAIVAIFVPRVRRYVAYVLLLQIVLGVAVWLRLHLAPPPAHWILAILVGGVWPMAGALERKGRPQAAVIAVNVVGVVVLALVAVIGTQAVNAYGVR